MESLKTKPYNCPSCGCEMNALSAIQGRADPTVGDMSVCIECAAPCVFESIDPIRLVVMQSDRVPLLLRRVIACLREVHAGRRRREDAEGG